MDGVALGMLLSNRKIAATQKVLNHQRHADRIVQTRQWVFSTSRTRHVGGCLAELTLQIHVPRSHKELKCPSAPGRARFSSSDGNVRGRSEVSVMVE